MENRKWHITVNLKLEDSDKNNVLAILDKLKAWEDANGIKDGGVSVKENPEYDSFGNLWE